MCIGETLAENEAGQTEAVLERQAREGLANVSAGDIVPPDGRSMLATLVKSKGSDVVLPPEASAPGSATDSVPLVRATLDVPVTPETSAEPPSAVHRRPYRTEV